MTNKTSSLGNSTFRRDSGGSNLGNKNIRNIENIFRNTPSKDHLTLMGAAYNASKQPLLPINTILLSSVGNVGREFVSQLTSSVEIKSALKNLILGSISKESQKTIDSMASSSKATTTEAQKALLDVSNCWGKERPNIDTLNFNSQKDLGKQLEDKTKKWDPEHTLLIHTARYQFNQLFNYFDEKELSDIISNNKLENVICHKKIEDISFEDIKDLLSNNAKKLFETHDYGLGKISEGDPNQKGLRNIIENFRRYTTGSLGEEEIDGNLVQETIRKVISIREIYLESFIEGHWNRDKIELLRELVSENDENLNYEELDDRVKNKIGINIERIVEDERTDLLKEKLREILGNNVYEMANNVIGCIKLGETLKKIGYDGRILNLTNPLETCTTCLGITSGLPLDRVTGFRHNDIIRIIEICDDLGIDPEEHIHNSIGFHSRSWHTKESGVLSYLFVHEQGPKLVKERVGKTVSGFGTTAADTVPYLIDNIEIVARKSEDEETTGSSWMHKDENIYFNIAGYINVDKETGYPKETLIENSTVNNVEQSLIEYKKNKPKHKKLIDSILTSIECERIFFNRLHREGILEQKLDKAELQLRKEKINSARNIKRENIFQVIYRKGKRILSYNDAGDYSEVKIKGLVTDYKLFPLDKKMILLLTRTEEGSKRSLPKKYLQNIELNKDGYKIQKEWSLKKETEEIGNNILITQNGKIYVCKENPFLENENVEEIFSDDFLSPTRVMMEINNVPYLIYANNNPNERGLYKRVLLNDEWIEKEIFLEQVIDLKTDKNFIIAITEPEKDFQRIVVHNPEKEEYISTKKIGHKKFHIEDLKTNGNEILYLDEGVIYNLNSSIIESQQDSKVVRYEVWDDKISWINKTGRFRLKRFEDTELLLDNNLREFDGIGGAKDTYIIIK